MKNLTKRSVKNVFELLVEAKGETTTLEIKLQLRDLGFKATQQEVSDFMDEIYREEDDVEFSDNGTFRTYTIVSADFYADDVDEDEDDWDIFEDEKEEVEDINMSVSATSDIFDDIINQSNKDIQSAVDDFNQSVLDNGRQIPSMDDEEDEDDVTDSSYITPGGYDVSKPLPTGNYFRDRDVVNSPEVQEDENTWVVRAKDGIFPVNTPIYTFDSGLTSDKVRSRYATLTGQKIQDIRARRARNVKVD